MHNHAGSDIDKSSYAFEGSLFPEVLLYIVRFERNHASCLDNLNRELKDLQAFFSEEMSPASQAWSWTTETPMCAQCACTGNLRPYITGAQSYLATR